VLRGLLQAVVALAIFSNSDLVISIPQTETLHFYGKSLWQSCTMLPRVTLAPFCWLQWLQLHRGKWVLPSFVTIYAETHLVRLGSLHNFPRLRK